MKRVEIDLDDDESRKLWKAVATLVDRLPRQWVLVGAPRS